MSMWTNADLEQLHDRGIAVEQAEAQIDRLRKPARFVDLLRPCTPGDGIEILSWDDLDELSTLGDAVARESRCLKFVPASGAATRMFKGLQENDAEALETFIRGIDRFAFAGDLRDAVSRSGHDLDALARRGHADPILEALLGEDEMDYGRLPKGLLEFHAYPDGSRSPFEEHLVEAANVVKNADGACRVHFTVSPDHVKPFESLLGRVREKHEAALDTTFQVELSTQQPSTDTVAVDSSGLPFRRADGGLLFRPSGHGALLENLGGLDAEWVWMKNIDNTVPDHLKPATHLWARALLGFGARRRTGLPDRPVRVCGMVRNTGEPGGGPFWIRDAEGNASAHIVETAEIDPDASAHREILGRATHFNPVFMVCGLADRQGAPYDLRSFVDPDRAIVTEKSFEGRALRALERPGLWNGSMALWDTRFVEVPGDVFNPVKTVNDLLRDEHQPAVR